MDRPKARPFRATIYLPGQGEDGRWIPVRKVSAATEAALNTITARYVKDGYRVVAYEEQTLPMEDQ